MGDLRPGSRVRCEDGREGVVRIDRRGAALVYFEPIRLSRWLERETVTITTERNLWQRQQKPPPEPLAVRFQRE